MMRSRLKTLLFGLSALLGVSLLTGCLPDAAEVSSLKQEVETLRQELEAMGGGSSSGTPVGKLDELEQRITEIESARGETRKALAQEISDQNTKLARAFRSFDDVHEIVQTGQNWAALALGKTGHVVARTQHGAFLVELEDHEKTSSGYQLNLRIGNPNSLRVTQFTLKGDFGSPPPDHREFTDYDTFIQATDRWEASLKPFEATFMTPLEISQWTEVALDIPAQTLTDLQYIQFRLRAEHVELEKSEYDESFAETGIDAPVVPLLNTVHGAFPLDIRDSRPFSGGYQVDFYIGNPFFMQISNSRLLIQYGPERPLFDEAMDPADYRKLLVEWSQSLKTLEQPVSTMITPSNWNKVQVYFPTKNRDELKYMRVRWEVLNILLKQPSP